MTTTRGGKKERRMKKCVLFFSFFFFEAEREEECVWSKITKTLNTENRRVKTSSNASDVRINKQSNHDDDALLSFPGDDNFRASGLFPLDQ
jgi:hypothetical protein